MEPFGGPAFEPLTSSGCRPTRSEATVEPRGGPTFEPLISKGGLGARFLHREGSFSGYPPFPVPVARERKTKKGKGYEIERRGVPFLAWLLRRRRSVARFSCQRHRLSCRGVNATGRVVGGAAVRVREPFEERVTGASSSHKSCMDTLPVRRNAYSFR